MIDKDFFELEISEGLVVAPSHPAYFENRLRLFIRKDKGTAEIEDKGYTLDKEIINDIKNIIVANEKLLKKLSKEKENSYEGGSGTSLIAIIGNRVYGVSGDIRDSKAILFEKTILARIGVMIKMAVANGSAYVDENSPNPKKEAEEWTKNWELRHIREYERKRDFLKAKIARHEEMLKKLNSEQLTHDSQIVNECLNEIIIDPLIYNYQAENYIYPMPANKMTPPKKVEELTVEEIAKQLIFFKRLDYHNGSSFWIEEEGQDKVFIKLFERYCQLVDIETKSKIDEYELQIKSEQARQKYLHS